jgi:outer membrane protein OmpA-like peptidoglycan-associated protein
LPFNYNSAVDDAEPVEEMVMGEAAPVRQVYFPDVNFEFDKSGLTTLGRGKAQQIADLLGESPGMHVVLEGHTDYKGSESYNEKLGMKRAETVRKILLELGAPASSVSTVTFGKAQPALSQQTDWARAVNRRVEVHLDDGSAAPAEKAMEAMEEVPAGS